MSANQAGMSVRAMARLLGVSRSGMTHGGTGAPARGHGRTSA